MCRAVLADKCITREFRALDRLRGVGTCKVWALVSLYKSSSYCDSLGSLEAAVLAPAVTSYLGWFHGIPPLRVLQLDEEAQHTTRAVWNTQAFSSVVV